MKPLPELSRPKGAGAILKPERIKRGSPDCDGCKGKLVSGHPLIVTVYYNRRYWWWDYNSNRSNRFRYRRDNDTREVFSTQLVSASSPVEFNFKPEFRGRYYVEVKDELSGHSTGWSMYASSWGGGVSEMPQRADVLELSADRKVYAPGQTAKIRVETPVSGSALVSVEKGEKILWSRWFEVAGKELEFEVPVESNMLPNAYVSISLFQPLEERENDLPMRTYGIIPLMVEEPETHLPLKIQVADELAPDKEFEVELSLADGRAGWGYSRRGG